MRYRAGAWVFAAVLLMAASAPKKAAVKAPKDLVNSVLSDVRELEGPEAAVSVVKAEAVNWPDTSLGCPEEGVVYAEVVTPGYLIVVKSASLLYRYHAAKDKTFRLCKTEPLEE